MNSEKDTESLIAKTSVNQIDAQLQLLQCLQVQLTSNRLRQFLMEQPYGVHSDEYKIITQLKNTDPTNHKLQKNCRLAEYPSYFEQTIPSYNGNVHKEYIVCEGPDPENKDSVERFLANIAMNKYHANLDTIIISGMPNDHFSKPYEHLLNYADYIPTDYDKSKVFGDFSVTRKPSVVRSSPGIEHILIEITRHQYGLTVSKQLDIFRFVTNPDLSRAQISPEDMPLLAEIASREPNRIAFHCGAGLSRSVSKLLMFIIFNYLKNNLSQFKKNNVIDATSFLNKVADEYRRIRVHRPGVVGNKDLLIEAISLALVLVREALNTYKMGFKFIPMQSRARIK